MAGRGTEGLGKLGKRKAKSGSSMDRLSNSPPLSSFMRGKVRISDGGMPDGTTAECDGEESDGPAEEWSEDPLVVFGSGIMTVILSKLDARSVALSRLVSRGWLAVASSDKIWASKTHAPVSGFSFIFLEFGILNAKSSFCFSSLEGKTILGNIANHEAETATELPEEAVLCLMLCMVNNMLLLICLFASFCQCEELWQGKAHIPRISKDPGLSKMAATSLSIMDGRRSRITRNDLCDHVWEFHFTEAAPEYWRSMDPYWQGTGRPMRRYFHPDGSITADADDKVWGGHESSYTIVTGLLADGKIREHYVRINRWPQMSVQRNSDWSWVLSNHLYCYTSVPDAHDKPEETGPFFPI